MTAPEQLTAFWFQISVRLHAPLDVVDERGRVTPVTGIGYYRHLAVTAATESAARKAVELIVTDGVIDWDDSSWRVIDPQQSPAIGGRVGIRDSKKEGVWYQGGHVFY